MGLGGYLTWTAVARELNKKYGQMMIPIDMFIGKGSDGSSIPLVKLKMNKIFYNNPHIIQEFSKKEGVLSREHGIQVQINSENASYCKSDMIDKVVHKSDRHIIETACLAAGIKNPELKCEIYLDEKEKRDVKELVKEIDGDFITVEPYSKKEYTVNREYPFEKWQKIVNELSMYIKVVQLGIPESRLLDNVIDFRGRTTFRTAGGIIGQSIFLISTEGGLTHLATAFKTPAVVIITGYQSKKMVSYPQNFYIDISSHGPCGLKDQCLDCKADAESHDFKEVSSLALKFLKNAEVI